MGYDHANIDEYIEDGDDVFRLGSDLLESGAVEGGDSNKKMKMKDNEVPIVFVDQHHEGKQHNFDFFFPWSHSLNYLPSPTVYPDSPDPSYSFSP